MCVADSSCPVSYQTRGHRDGRLNALTGGLIVVDVDALQLQVRVAVVGTGGVNAVLVGDHLPEL